MRRFLPIILLIILSCSCGCTDRTELENKLSPITVSRIVINDGKPCLEVDGQPFAMYGAQIRIDIFRNCEEMSWKEIEKYFVKAVELNLNTVELNYCWAHLEPKEGVYDFEEIDKLLELLNSYDLKGELLWFGSNMIGDSYSWLVPVYVLSKPEVKLLSNDHDLHFLYGYRHILKLDDTWVLERESKAITTLFDHIRKWDEEHGSRHPIITAQIENEPDALVRWRMQEKEFKNADGSALTQDAAWKMTLKSLDVLGRAVHNSSYRVATRTNVISGNGIAPYPQASCARPGDVYALEGIDFLSFDPYMTEVNKIASEVSAYASLQGNYPLVAENRGDFGNTASLILATSVLGGGYDIYDLATSKILASGQPPFNTEGVLQHDLSDKPHTPQVRTLLKGLTGAEYHVALTKTEDFAAFNIVTDYPEQNCSQTICTTGARIGFSTNAGALAFVLDRGSFLVAYSTAAASLNIGSGVVSTVEKGSFGPDGNFVSSSSVAMSGSAISLEEGELYRIGFSSVGSLESTTKKHIGTLFR